MRFKIHLVTVIATALLASVLVGANLFPELVLEATAGRLEIVRVSADDGQWVTTGVLYRGWPFVVSWSLDQYPDLEPVKYNRENLYWNFSIAICVLFYFAISAEFWVRRWGWRVRFSVRSALATMLLAGIVLGYSQISIAQDAVNVWVLANGARYSQVIAHLAICFLFFTFGFWLNFRFSGGNSGT